MHRLSVVILCASVGFCWVGCSEDSNGDASDPADAGCEVCHAIDDIGPSHAVHLSTDKDFMDGGMLCSECHPMDDAWVASGHMNREVEVGFNESEMAGIGGVEPAFDGERCQNVYCHGATLSGGTTPSPAWNTSVESACGMCHSLPPTENHVDEDECEDCHSAAYTDGALNDNHLNGTVNVYGAD